MASSPDNVSMALFCDFENVALGVRDAKYDKFDIKPVLERLLLKGSIVVKKAYCDWERYKGFKAAMHEANFELIEIPHVRQSGKNSADIRLVVDALDLCYTKSHVNTFVIISGDSDFSPLVSKLRENAKQVIGVGVKQSTSDLLIANCDEFIFYDDLARESQRKAARRETREVQPAAKRPADDDNHRKEELEARKTKAIEIAVETFDALVSERGDSGSRIWASMLKEAIKRRKPDFNESYYGFRAFGNLLEEAQARGLLEFGRDEKSGAYVYRSSGKGGGADHGVETPVAAVQAVVPEAAAHVPAAAEAATDDAQAKAEPRRKSRGGRKPATKKSDAAAAATDAGGVVELPGPEAPEPETVRAEVSQAEVSQAEVAHPETAKPDGRRTRRGRTQTAKRENARPEPATAEPVASAPETSAIAEPSAQAGPDEAPAKPVRKSAARSRRPRKTEAPQG
jgi:uncharacterized LabA/DUF88 family protein